MDMLTATNLNNLPVVGSSYFSFTKACFFAGLFCRDRNKPLSGL